MSSEASVLENQIDRSVSIAGQHEAKTAHNVNNDRIVTQVNEFMKEISLLSGSKSSKVYCIFICFTILIMIIGSLIVYYKSPGPPGIYS